MNCLRGNMTFWLAKCFKSDLHEACCIFTSVLVQGKQKTPQILPDHTVITSQNRYFWVPNNDTIAHKIPFNLQPVQAMWPFANYFIHPLRHAYQKYTYPFTWITSYLFTWRRNEWILFDSPNKILSQGSKKKITGTNRAPTHLHVGGQEGHGVEQSTDPNGLQQLPLREGRELGTSWRGKGRSTCGTPWTRETPRSWNHWKQMSHFTM